MTDARTVIARALYEQGIGKPSSVALVDAILSALTAARLAVVPVPEGEIAALKEAVVDAARKMAAADNYEDWEEFNEEMKAAIRALAAAQQKDPTP